jgi:hypothetical protein
MGLYETENAVVLDIKIFKVNLTLLFLCLLEINFNILFTPLICSFTVKYNLDISISYSKYYDNFPDVWKNSVTKYFKADHTGRAV